MRNYDARIDWDARDWVIYLYKSIRRRGVIGAPFPTDTTRLQIRILLCNGASAPKNLNTIISGADDSENGICF